MNKKLMKKAFTLVEMLIVVVIIGILIAALLPKFKGAQKSARDTSRKAALSNYSTAIVGYFATNNDYPPTGGACTDSLTTTLASQMTAEIKDPEPTNVAYGTVVTAGCTAGKFGYAKLAGSEGGVLTAKMEVVGKTMNAIIDPDLIAADIIPGKSLAYVSATNSNANYAFCSQGLSEAAATALPSTCTIFQADHIGAATLPKGHYVNIVGNN